MSNFMTSTEKKAIVIIALIFLIPSMLSNAWMLTEVWRLLFIPSMLDYAGLIIAPLPAGVAFAWSSVVSAFFPRSTSSELEGKTFNQYLSLMLGYTLTRPLMMVLLAWIAAGVIFRGG